jgi:hypothetical protein
MFNPFAITATFVCSFIDAFAKGFQRPAAVLANSQAGCWRQPSDSAVINLTDRRSAAAWVRREPVSH